MSTSELNIPIDSPLKLKEVLLCTTSTFRTFVETFYIIYSCFLYNVHKFVLVSWYIVHFCTHTSSKSATTADILCLE